VVRRRLILLVPLLALFAFVATAEERAEGATWTCTGTHIYPTDQNNRPTDIDARINSDPADRPTTFCVHAGTYQVSEPAILKAGDKLEGEPGGETIIDTATIDPPIIVPTPVVKLEGSATDNLLRARGNPISIRWVDLTGASVTGTGSGAITAGSAGSDFLVEFVRIHDNASVGISNMKGRIFHSEFFKNSYAGSAPGFNGSAIKGITEYEAGNLYVHEEQGNGLWCDVGCSNDSKRVNGFWVHDSVVVNSGRAGIRYENSPNQALFENNEIHGNAKIEESRGGIDIRDSQNAWVGPGNNFGRATITIAGVAVNYPPNGSNRIGVRATDSGRSDRVNLYNVDVVGNNFGLADSNLNRDRIIPWPCPPTGQVVACSNNTNVGTK
jgi:hypothetical protein